MQILLANHSAFPGGPEPTTVSLAIDAAVRAQEEAGLDVVTDGASPDAAAAEFLARLDGVRLDPPGGPLDSAATLVVHGTLRRREPPSTALVRHTLSRAHAAVKVVLTGSFTLARMARRTAAGYPTVADLALDFSALLAEDVHAAVAAGARRIHIDEPLILDSSTDPRLLRVLFEPLRGAAGDLCELTIATNGADATPLYAQLHSVPADVVAVDLTCAPAVLDAITDTGAGKMLALGLVNGQSASLESVAAVAMSLERALRRYVHERIYVQPSCGMQKLTRAEATAKLDVLHRARNAVIGRESGR